MLSSLNSSAKKLLHAPLLERGANGSRRYQLVLCAQLGHFRLAVAKLSGCREASKMLQSTATAKVGDTGLEPVTSTMST